MMMVAANEGAKGRLGGDQTDERMRRWTQAESPKRGDQREL